jgi:hypothetical protein
MKIVLGHNGIHPIEIDVKELLISNLLVEGATRSGKSYAVRKLLELLATIVQIIVIDPEGELASLREKFDFLYAGLDELPMSIHTAGELARSLVETRASCICDLSELKVTDRKHWVRIFVESLMESPKTTWHNEKIVFIDEAHLFAPEKDKAESLAAVVDLAGRGQKRGFTLICATQRISKLSKDVISELQNVLVGRHTLDIDRERAAETLGVGKKTMVDFMAKIKVMDRGTFFGLGSAISDEMVTLKVDKVVTTHPERGQKLTVPPPPSEKVRSILEKLKDLPAKVEKKLRTEQDLRERIHELEFQVREAQRPAAEPEPVNIGISEEDAAAQAVQAVNAYKDSILLNLRDYLKRLDSARLALDTGYRDIDDFVAKLNHLDTGTFITTVPKLPPTTRYSSAAPNPPGNTPKERPVTSGPKVPLRLDNPNRMPPGEKAILIAIAQTPRGATKSQLRVTTGYKQSAMDSYVSRLIQKGHIIRERDGDNFIISPSGLAALGSDYEPLPHGKRLQEYWLKKLPKGEAAILQCAIRYYPRTVTKDYIAQATGYKDSARDSYVSRLSARKLLESPARGELKASALLF